MWIGGFSWRYHAAISGIDTLLRSMSRLFGCSNLALTTFTFRELSDVPGFGCMARALTCQPERGSKRSRYGRKRY